MAATDPSPLKATTPVTSVSTANIAPAPATNPGSEPSPLYSQGVPQPTGTTEGAEQRADTGANTDPVAGTGVEGELVVWEGRYSMRNFIGRLVFAGLLSAGWVALAIYTWGMETQRSSSVAIVAGVVVVILWIWFGFRMMRARYSHYYRLTTRRLFVSTGIVHRRRDMLELLRLKDVFTRQQSLLDRMLGLGTVVVVSSDKDMPTFYVAGVDDPKRVMDLIWHHARSERDQRSVKIDQV